MNRRSILGSALASIGAAFVAPFVKLPIAPQLPAPETTAEDAWSTPYEPSRVGLSAQRAENFDNCYLPGLKEAYFAELELS